MQKKKAGRKGKYETHIKPFLPAILEMRRTMTERQIAEKLGIAYSTFSKYKDQFPEFSEVLEKGKRNLVADLRSALIKRAEGYVYTEIHETKTQIKLPTDLQMKLLKSGVSEEELKELCTAQLVKHEVKHKQAHPDVAAINLALKNYDKNNWSNDPQMLELRKKEIELRERQIEQNEW